MVHVVVVTVRPKLNVTIPFVLFGLFRYWYIAESGVAVFAASTAHCGAGCGFSRAPDACVHSVNAHTAKRTRVAEPKVNRIVSSL